MGASLITIDRHYSHVPCDGRESSIRLLDELSAVQRPRWTLVDAGGRCVDAERRSHRHRRQRKGQPSRRKLEAL
jgi:hypothetical protein